MADQLLAAAHQHTVLECSRADATLDPCDEDRVLATDLVVEREQIVDPGLLDVWAEEVVEVAVRPLRCQGEARPDRDVRLAGKDVDLEVRPEAVERRTGARGRR